MNLTKQSLDALRTRIQMGTKRADELTGELCPSPTKLRIAPDITACVDLMLADVIDYLCSSEFALQQVEQLFSCDHVPGSVMRQITPTAIALVARAEQKVKHSFELLNHAQQMIDGNRSIWGAEIRHGALWDK